MASDSLEIDPTALLAPDLVEINRLPARAPLGGHDDAETARTDGESGWRMSLDGKWNFRLIENPERLPPSWPAKARPNGPAL